MWRDREFEQEAMQLLESRLCELKRLTFSEAAALPEAAGNDVEVRGARTAVTVFRQPARESDAVLVTLQVARRRILATYYPVFERGLVFSRSGAVRDATDTEMS